MLVVRGSKEETNIRNPSNLARANKVQEGLLNPSLVASKAIGSKNSPLRVWHHKLGASSRLIRKGLKP